MTAGVGAWNVPKNGYRQGMVVPDKTVDPYGYARVRFAVVALQRELIRQEYLVQPVAPLGGGYGPSTTKAATAFQRAHGLVADGWVGPKTARRLFQPLIVAQQNMVGIPDNLLYGQARLESGMDPGAEGRVDDRDRGLFQFNRRWWPAVTDELAFSDVPFCCNLSADTMKAAFLRLGRWDCATAWHNSPAKATEWARTGQPPDQQIADYVTAVYKAAADPV